MTLRILANDQGRARDASLEAFALNEEQLAPQGLTGVSLRSAKPFIRAGCSDPCVRGS
jgi:hypothetical protein